MVEYTVKGFALTMSEDTSRAAGHFAGMPGERTVDGSRSDLVRREVRGDAQALADRLGKSIEVYAHHPDAQDWIVDAVEPR